MVAAPTAGTVASGSLRNGIALADVTGGRDTNPAWTSQVSSESFRRALELSLESAGAYSRILSGSRYQLVADLLRLEQPLLGIDLTVTSTARYVIIDASTKREAYDRTITAPYTARFSDALIGAERLKLANEGAVRANIQQFVDDILSRPELAR